MTEEIVLLIQPGGTISGLWTDALDWSQIGPCEVSRASSVEFCAAKQKWEVILSDGTCIGKWSSREEAIRQEIRFLQERM